MLDDASWIEMNKERRGMLIDESIEGVAAMVTGVGCGSDGGGSGVVVMEKEVVVVVMVVPRR